MRNDENVGKSKRFLPYWVDEFDKPSRLRRFAALFFPERCYSCGAITACGEKLCERCVPKIIPVLPPICIACGRQEVFCECENGRLGPRKHLSDLKSRKSERQERHIYGYLAPFYYKSAARDALHQFKFNEKQYIADFFAPAMAKMVKELLLFTRFDYITCVPISKKTFSKRGYNQSRLLAERVGEILDLEYFDTLVKVKENLPQRELDAAKRTENVRGVYELCKNLYSRSLFENGGKTKPDLKGKTILLIDDIITTGSTLRECGRVLAGAEPYRVYALAAATTEFNE